MERTPPDFEHFITARSDAGADFVIVGGYAMVLHGSDDVTSDIDVAVARDRENARRVARALSSDEPRPEGWPEGLPFVWDEETVRRATILTLLTHKGSIDVLGETPGVDARAELRGRAVWNDVYGQRVCGLPSTT